MAKSSNVVKFHDDERKLAEKANAIRVWQRQLRDQPEVAAVMIGQTLSRLDRSRLYHRTEIAKAKSQMVNGVCCPSDFATTDAGASQKIL